MPITSQLSWKLRFALGWLFCGLLLSIQPFLRHIDFFRNTGPLFPAIKALPFLLIAAALAHSKLRSKGWWRYELNLLTAVVLGVALLSQPRATLVILWLALASFSLGSAISQRLSLKPSEAPIAVLLGLGSFILVLTAVGRLGGFYPWVFVAILSIPLPFLFRFRASAFASILHPYHAWKRADELATPTASLAVFFSFIFACCSLLMMLTPVMAFDVLAYHLPLAELYNTTHRLQPLASIPQSFYPQGFEVLLSLASSLGGRMAAQMVAPLFFLLFLWIAFRIARECGESTAGTLIGVVAAGTLPFLHWTGSVPKNDMASSAFQLASLYAFLQWTKARGFAWIIAGVFFLGQSFGIKHVALFGAIPLAMLFAFAVYRQPRPWRAAILLGTVLLISGFSWHLDTFLRTGNPIFPEGSQKVVHGGFQEHGKTVADVIMRYITMPWYLFFHGWDAFESPTPNPAGMFLVFFAPLPILLRREWTSARRACAFLVVLYLAYWSTMLSSLRYAIVPFTLITLVVAGAATRWELQSPLWMQHVFRFGVFTSFLFALMSILTFEVNSLQLAYLFKKVDETGYLSQALPTTPVLFSLGQGNAHPAVFGVENCSRLYAPDPTHFGCLLCGREHCSLAELKTKLAESHYDYLILPTSPQYDDWRKDLLETHQISEAYHDSKFVSYRLLDGSSTLTK